MLRIATNRLIVVPEVRASCPLVGWGRRRSRSASRLGSFAALDQRIALRYELAGMTAAETDDYLTHWVRLAGREDSLFSDDAVELLRERSRGIPRALNNLATQALVATFIAQKSIVDSTAAHDAVTEVYGE